MIKFKEIEHFDNFGDSVIFWCIAQDIPKKYINQAKKIDGENYLDDCFGVCVTFDAEGFHICQNEPDSELYYVDTDGDKHWMDRILKDTEAKTFFEACFEEITTYIPE